MKRKSLKTNCMGTHLTCRALAFAGLLLLALAAPSHRAAALDIEPLWTADPDMVMEAAPMIADLNGDGGDEVLTAAYENIIVLDGSGTELWRFDTRGRYSTCPALLERDGHVPLIYAGDNKGMFTCLDGSGKVVWQADMAPVFCASPGVADLDGNGSYEVIQGDKSGHVTAFDALTGKPVWKRALDGECASPAIGDLDGDGDLEVIITTGAGKLFALDAGGQVVWDFALGGTSPDWATASPILFGTAAGDVCAAAASSEGRLFCLDGRGAVRWERATRGAVASALSAGDLDQDGRAEIFAVTQLGVLHRFDEEGRVLWDIDTQGRSLAPGAIIDLDGDGTLEFALCTQRGNLLVFDVAGKVVFNHQFENRTINMTLAFGQLDTGRPGLEFAVTGGESGRVFCFGTSAPAKTAWNWRTYRGDNRLSGAWLGLTHQDALRMTPDNLSWDQILTGGAVMFRIANPSPNAKPLKAEAACQRPDGTRQAAVGKVLGSQGLLKLPVSVCAPGVYHFEWALRDASGAEVLAGARDLTLQPYANDQALARRAVLALRESAAAAHEGVGVAMAREAFGIEQEADALAALQAAAPGAAPSFIESLDARTAALNARAERGWALARVARSIPEDAAASPIIPFEGAMWENRGVDAELPEAVVLPLRIHRRCVTGEHEPVSVKLFNPSLETVTVQGRAEAAQGGPAVTLYEVKSVPTNQGTTAWDPLKPMGKGGMAIPPLATRELWVDLDLTAVKAGAHAVKLVLDTGTAAVDAAIALDVLPFKMAGFGAMRLCCWSSYTSQAMEDLLAHGNNVFVSQLPPATVGEGTPPKIEVDFKALDEYLAPLAKRDIFLLMGGVPALGVPMEEEAYVPRFADYLEQVMAHLAAFGIKEEHVALYPHDEPGVHGWDTVNHFIAFARQGLKARPGLQVYVNGGGDLAMFKAFNEVAAIWCPFFSSLSEDSPEMAFLRKSGKTLWSYDCAYVYARPIGANTKTINIVAQYRLAAPFGFTFGATGIGFWCYNVGPSMWDPIELEYPLVYTNEDGSSIPSRRWEAVREGMEDTRILIALRDKLDDKGVSADAKAKIRHLLEKTLPGTARQSAAEARLGAARYVIDASNNDDTVARLRAEMLDCVAAFVR